MAIEWQGQNPVSGHNAILPPHVETRWDPQLSLWELAVPNEDSPLRRIETDVLFLLIIEA